MKNNFLMQRIRKSTRGGVPMNLLFANRKGQRLVEIWRLGSVLDRVNIK